MKLSSTLPLATLLLASSADAINLAKRSEGPPKVLRAPIQRKHVENVVKRELQRRAKTVSETLDNLETLYFANASLGTPKQTLRLHIDTGSSDLWVNTPNSTLCSGQGDPCSVGGTYDANSSSTYTYVNSDFSITYVDGSNATGDYVKDTFYFGSQTLEDFQFGIGYTSTSEEGVLGIGYMANEVLAGTTGKTYANLPQALVNAGLINSNAYSLWLNDLDANTGSILFGGVDTEKYHGSLQTLPIIKSDGVYSQFAIALTGMDLSYGSTSGSIFSNQTVPVILDSGSSFTYLPDDVCEVIYDQFDVSYSESTGYAIADCSLADSSGYLNFTFTSPTIQVPLNELVLVAGSDGRGDEICVLGISPAGDSVSVLGDTFLRSAYVVYDLANNEISLASTNYNSTSTNIEEITTGSTAVPDATGVANAVSTGAVGSNGARIGSASATSTGGAVAMATAGVGIAAAMGAGAMLLAL